MILAQPPQSKQLWWLCHTPVQLQVALQLDLTVHGGLGSQELGCHDNGDAFARAFCWCANRQDFNIRQRDTLAFLTSFVATWDYF